LVRVAPEPKSRFPMWLVMICGYLTMGRAFAYVGVPPLFIGELYLGAGMLKNKHNWVTKFVDDVVHLEPMPVAITLHLVWGIAEIFRVLFMGQSPVEAIRTAAFNYYPLYIPLGIAIGRDLSLRQFVSGWKVLCLVYVAYGILFEIFADEPWGLPWNPAIVIWNAPTIATLVPVGTLALWPYLRDWKLRHVMTILSLLPLLFAPGRGTFIALLIGLVVVALSSKAHARLIGIGFVTIGGLMFVVGPMLPGLPGRAKSLDPMVNVARVVATVDPDAAYSLLARNGYSDEAEHLRVAEGTARWRQVIWTNAMHSLSTTTLILFGQGHGASLHGLTPDGQELHTPHNFVIYCIYYTGAIGCVIFAFFLLTLFLAARQVQDSSLRALLLSSVLSVMMVAAVGNLYETPAGAIPFYLLFGLAIGIDRRLAQATEPSRLRRSGVQPRARRGR
jgi:hypothetical protein